jgi:hypothetical protein
MPVKKHKYMCKWLYKFEFGIPNEGGKIND